MSNALVTQVRKLTVGQPLAKYILLYLADCHNPKFGCFPSQVTIAADLELSVQSVRRHLLYLEKKGFIKRTFSQESGRIQRTNYDLLIPTESRDTPYCGIPTTEDTPYSQEGHPLLSDTSYILTNRKLSVSSNAKLKKQISMSQDDWIETLKKEAIYAHVDFDCELRKAELWIQGHPGRKLTKKFFTNWINKIEAPLTIQTKPTLSEEEIAGREAVRLSWAAMEYVPLPEDKKLEWTRAPR